MARIGGGVHKVSGTNKVLGVPRPVDRSTSVGKGPSGHPRTGKAVPSNPDAAAAAGVAKLARTTGG